MVDGIRLGRVGGIQGKEDTQKYQRDRPCVFRGIALACPEESPSFSTFGEGSSAISLGLRLLRLFDRQFTADRRGALWRTFIVPGEGGRISTVAKAGAPVSPALISPPSPLDFLRLREPARPL